MARSTQDSLLNRRRVLTGAALGAASLFVALIASQGDVAAEGTPSPTPTPTPTPPPAPRKKCNSGRGNGSEPAGDDCDPGNSGGKNQGGD